MMMMTTVIGPSIVPQPAADDCVVVDLAVYIISLLLLLIDTSVPTTDGGAKYAFSSFSIRQ